MGAGYIVAKMIEPHIDFRKLAIASRRVIQESDFSRRERAILHIIVEWSFDRGLEWAKFEKLEDFSKLTGLLESHISSTITGLQRSGLLYVKRWRSNRSLGQVSCLEIRFLPKGALAPAPSNIDATEAAQVRAKLERLNSLPAGFEPSGQKRLGFAPSIDDQVDEELATNSSTAAIDELDLAGREPTDSGGSIAGFGREPTDSGGRRRQCALVPSYARAAAAAEHVHVSIPTGSHGHVHARKIARIGEENLTGAESDLLGQIRDLTLTEGNTEAFATMWILRIRDFPNAVFKAIAETRVTSREGRIRRTIGGTLNWNFKRYRDSLAQKP